MTASTILSNRTQVPIKALAPFMLITFGLAWGILALYIFLPEPMVGLFGSLTGEHPLFFLAVYAPAIAALTIVGYCGGSNGLLRFLSRLLLWRCSIGWYAFLIFVIPLVYFGCAALFGDLLDKPFEIEFGSALAMALFFTMIKGPIEEFGWRGMALPLLQRKFAPLWAGLIIGLIWGFWHLPAFLLSGTPQSAWSFTPFFAGSVAVSVIATALFNRSRGSILLPMLLHFQLNNPIWPDAQPYDMYTFVLLAVLVVYFNRKVMLSRIGSVTEVIPQG